MVSGHNGVLEDDEDDVAEAEPVVVLGGLTTTELDEEVDESDVVLDVLDLDVADDEDPCEAEEAVVVLEILEGLEAPMLVVGLIVVVGSGVDETTIVELDWVLVVTDVGRDELVELAVETAVDDVLTSAQSVDTQ